MRKNILARFGLDQGQYTSLFWLFVLGMLWGASYLFIKVTVAEVSPLTLVAGRLLMGTIIMWGLLFASGHSVPRSPSLWGAYAVMGLLSGALPYTLISWGEKYISSGLASLLQATMPLFTAVLAHFLADDERITLIRMSGVIMGFLGVGILLLPDLLQGLQANVLGQLAVVVSSLSYAAAAVFARRWLRRQPALVSTTGQLTMGMVFMLPFSLLVDRPFDLSLSLPAVASWLGLTILGTVVAYVIYYALIERTNATFVSMVTYIIPVNGLFLGVLVLGESLNAILLSSLGLVLLGVLLVRR